MTFRNITNIYVIHVIDSNLNENIEKSNILCDKNFSCPYHYLFENPSTELKISILFDLHWKMLKLR